MTERGRQPNAKLGYERTRLANPSVLRYQLQCTPRETN